LRISGISLSAKVTISFMLSLPGILALSRFHDQAFTTSALTLLLCLFLRDINQGVFEPPNARGHQPGGASNASPGLVTAKFDSATAAPSSPEDSSWIGIDFVE
jgi:hypothetical protein